jgi:rod shape-determining protein MreB
MFGVPAYLAEDPLFCVAKGTGLVLDHLDTYKQALLTKRAW